MIFRLPSASISRASIESGLFLSGVNRTGFVTEERTSGLQPVGPGPAADLRSESVEAPFKAFRIAFATAPQGERWA